ncbi:hypothetical protein KIL84_012315 [Mauremys mutica]|uniref:Uncharacterized protein n=1 Tax=Mauremys mutica TaxID=74926 RepID=A0A9D3XFW2_9SAUR|nr:hypothetical protein KIL84_012315 [Mauremys mutica]
MQTYIFVFHSSDPEQKTETNSTSCYSNEILKSGELKLTETMMKGIAVVKMTEDEDVDNFSGMAEIVLDISEVKANRFADQKRKRMGEMLVPLKSMAKLSDFTRARSHFLNVWTTNLTMKNDSFEQRSEMRH